jgi:uroporphyrinogen-III synthase
LVVKGRDGRQLLQQELTQRGAAVMCADVYERVAATPDEAALTVVQERFAAGGMHVVTATSLDIGESLLKLATPALRAAFERAHWLVPGERVAAGLRALGLQAPQLVADSAEDQDLVAALVRWRSIVSGA